MSTLLLIGKPRIHFLFRKRGEEGGVNAHDSYYNEKHTSSLCLHQSLAGRRTTEGRLTHIPFIIAQVT